MSFFSGFRGPGCLSLQIPVLVPKVSENLENIRWLVVKVCFISHFFLAQPKSRPQRLPLPLERGAEWMVSRSRVPDTSRGRRMAQSDGLVRRTILSVDGHPKGASGHELARSQQLPTAVPPPKIFASFYCLRVFSQVTGCHRESSRVITKNRPPISSKHENSPVLAESFSIFLK